MNGNVLVGLSGWRYEGWRGKFYPEGLNQRQELTFLAERFPTVEINGSFYSLQSPRSYQTWFDATPPDFVFAVKGGRYLTHMKRLKDIEAPLANFFASGLLKLKNKLGPFLWQLPPNFKYDRERIENFLKMLPRTGAEAIRLARRHDDKVAGKNFIPTKLAGELRHSLEVRHESFKNSEFIDLLREHDVSLVMSDSPGHWPYFEDLTSRFVYMRLHGHSKLYTSGYSNKLLEQIAERISVWNQEHGQDVYVYFDNDAKVKAPGDATKLIAILDKRYGMPLLKGA